ncbi:MAG TPA: hypothetical protein VIP78_13135, partial [Candidatus Dormibacteraeota bacterium]
MPRRTSVSGRRETFDQSAARSFARLPGWDLVTVGMQDLAEGKVTVETELMRSASRRLHELGFDVPPAEGESARLYELVAAEVGEA